MDVVFYEAFEEEKKALKKYLPDKIKVSFTDKTIQEAGDSACPASLISTRTQSVIPVEWQVALKGILSRSTGYDHLSDYMQKVDSRISYGYLPDYCSRAVAEQAVLMVMALLRKLKKQRVQFESFNRGGITGRECFGKNVLVLGVGRIGSHIVDIVSGIGMNAKGVDIVKKRQDVEYVSLNDGMSWAQIIICAMSLTPETCNMLDYDVFKAAGNDKVFVNIGRGEISPTADLKKLLDENILSSVGLDVYQEEGVLAEYFRTKNIEKDRNISAIEELQHRDNVLFTPHNAFNTQESVERKARQSVEAIIRFLANNVFPDAVLLR